MHWVYNTIQRRSLSLKSKTLKLCTYVKSVPTKYYKQTFNVRTIVRSLSMTAITINNSKPYDAREKSFNNTALSYRIPVQC